MLLIPKASWYGASYGYGDVTLRVGDFGLVDEEGEFVVELRWLSYAFA